jgi:hypothetical protein
MNLIWKWLATRAASGWILGICGIALAFAVGYIQQLRVDAARCKATEEVSEQVERLTERVARNVERDADEQIRSIRQSPDECAGARVPDSILDSLRAQPRKD